MDVVPRRKLTLALFSIYGLCLFISEEAGAIGLCSEGKQFQALEVLHSVRTVLLRPRQHYNPIEFSNSPSWDGHVAELFRLQDTQLEAHPTRRVFSRPSARDFTIHTGLSPPYLSPQI